MSAEEMNTLVELLRKWATATSSTNWDTVLLTAHNKAAGLAATLNVKNVSPSDPPEVRRPA